MHADLFMLLQVRTGILVDVSTEENTGTENGVDEGIELGDGHESGKEKNEHGAGDCQTTEETLTNDKNAEHMKEEV